MRAMSAKLLLEARRKRKSLGAEIAGDRALDSDVNDVNPIVGSESGPIAGKGEGHDAGAEGGSALGGIEAEQRGETTAVEGEGGSAGFVEFLPVEWFNEVSRLGLLFSLEITAVLLL